MASITIKKACIKCNKGGGTAMCYGCEQAFCTKHFIEHRQELSQQMDSIGQEHDILCRDLTHEQYTHSLLARINQWEQESIIKIQIAAKLARNDLQQLLDTAKNNLKKLISKITEELQSSRESDDYTEKDIKKWTVQLEEFRKTLNTPTTINFDYENDTQSTIRLIKITDQSSSIFSYQASQLYETNNQICCNLETSFHERFNDIFGRVTLSEGSLLATCSGDYSDRSCVGCIGRYSSGIHYIRFRFEHINTDHYSFFGIVNSSEKMTKDILNSTSFYGWWDLIYNVISGKKHKYDSTKIIRTGDEVTFMLDCDNRQIQLEHHRTNRILTLPINIQLCAFPWKIIVLLLGKDDCVRILH
ncbi:unnamed protein product [Rotaria sordida]|uniref:B box-type domain-containing protein n=1 Tax=Rotaria sordida TaxID=392033 RepID=A0A814Z7A3_9BILA|nr:unnamed protein product [Rotaria sordida]CAF3931780.1 unnamed protein product [Rotaria sordida]